MTTTRPTHADGIKAAQAIADAHGLRLSALRGIAAEYLSEGWPEGEGMGSSDISIQLAYMGNYEPELLTAEAERLAKRDAKVREIAASTGMTEEETLRGLQALFAPKQ